MRVYDRPLLRSSWRIHGDPFETMLDRSAISLGETRAPAPIVQYHTSFLWLRRLLVRLLGILAVGGTILSIMGCASVGTLNRADEAQHFGSNGKNNVTSFWRCQYGVVPFGHRGAEFLDGVCGVVNGEVVVRKFDRKSSSTSAGIRVSRTDAGGAASFCDSALLKQVQLRLPTGTLAMIFRPDGGVGMNDDAAKAFARLLLENGWQTRLAETRLDHAVGPGFNGHGPLVSC